MPDVDERFDSIDQTLTGVSRQFGKVDEQFTEVKQLLDTMDQRLNSMDERLDTLTREVQNVRVLGEDNSTQIRLIAEVQTHHGRLLDQVVRDIEPLKVLPDLFKQVVQDHERRITALERGSGSRP